MSNELELALSLSDLTWKCRPTYPISIDVDGTPNSNTDHTRVTSLERSFVSIPFFTLSMSSTTLTVLSVHKFYMLLPRVA